ncbi:MAG: nicotinate-nucleotide--dimethylbenzimidazole phosphoribosyltransferase, partial [Pseudomonadales bacterium]|nr:nicotinate-nucleotide--dimethylbenzimidazole phosphoribosyltransferase [Pseudomonadales bacterium]
DQNGFSRKVMTVKKALEKHQALLGDPISILQCLGGFEIAALVGAYTHCAQLGLPVLIDGFICTVAALMAVNINPDVKDWLIFAHQSAEQGHQKVLQALAASPLLSLGMRLGEGSGAAAAVPLLRMACRLHNKMATFDDAGVSDKT